GARRARAGGDLAGVADPGRERVAQLLRILGAQVDLVLDPVEGERDGLVGRPTVEVVDENYLDFLSHCGYLTSHGKNCPRQDAIVTTRASIGHAVPRTSLYRDPPCILGHRYICSVDFRSENARPAIRARGRGRPGPPRPAPPPRPAARARRARCGRRARSRAS